MERHLKRCRTLPLPQDRNHLLLVRERKEPFAAGARISYGLGTSNTHAATDRHAPCFNPATSACLVLCYCDPATASVHAQPCPHLQRLLQLQLRHDLHEQLLPPRGVHHARQHGVGVVRKQRGKLLPAAAGAHVIATQGGLGCNTNVRAQSQQSVCAVGNPLPVPCKICCGCRPPDHVRNTAPRVWRFRIRTLSPCTPPPPPRPAGAPPF